MFVFDNWFGFRYLEAVFFHWVDMDLGLQPVFRVAWNQHRVWMFLVEATHITSKRLVKRNREETNMISDHDDEKEYRVIAYAIRIICELCAACPEIVVDKLTGYTWTEEEAEGIKRVL